ncbi:DNA polymerase I [soil metagenome]
MNAETRRNGDENSFLSSPILRVSAFMPHFQMQNRRPRMKIMPKKSFYIIDGHAQIYRAYFAPFRDLTSPTGEPTKATYVFTQMLINLVEKRKPDYLAMVIDTPEEVFRSKIFPEYKANRKETPDDFRPQEQRIMKIVKDAGVPIFSKPGFEADDVIATMATRLEGEFDVFLVSKDKDLRQILDDQIRMYDVQSDETFGPPELLAKLGYTPQQAVEVQTLMGDAIDNVPGIPSVGEKTAVKLVQKYGSADAVLDHLDDLTPKLRENFEQHKDRLPVARQLVTLKRDVDVEFDAASCEFRGLDKEAIRPQLIELGFASLAKRLGGDGADLPPPPPVKKPSNAKPGEIGLFGAMEEPSPGAAAPAAAQDYETSADCDYRLINTPEALDRLLDELSQQKRFAFDTETDALGAMCSNCIGLSVSWQAKSGYYIAVCGPSGSTFLDRDSTIAKLKAVLEDDSIEKVGHNIKYDLQVMRQLGINVRGVVMDTMIAAFLLDPTRNQYGIDSLALSQLHFKKIPTEDIIGKGKNSIGMNKVDIDRVARYASEDADIAWRLSQLYGERLKAIPEIEKLSRDLETPLIDVLVEMESNGVSVDPAILKEQSLNLGHRIDELKQQIMTAAGGEFNPDSPKQLAEVLFDRLKLRVIKKTKTGLSTDVEVLEKLSLEHPVPKLMLEYRSLTKLKNTYLDNLTSYINDRTHRIHASFSQIGAETGRLSCSDPNLQNIPIRTEEGRAIRLAFVPGDRANNVLLTADYSQIELRVLAHYTQEPALVKAFENDEDIHRAVAAEVFHVPLAEVSKDQRNQAKTVNFGIIYGVTAFGLARRIDGLSVGAAQELINAYNKRFPSIQQFMQECVEHAQRFGYVQTLMGRRRPLPDINSAVIAIRNGSERMAINSVVQGSAADMIKIAMLNVYRRLRAEKRPSKLLMQVHDELVFETPTAAVDTDAEIVRQEMQNAMSLRVPIKVEVGWGKNWDEGK